MKIRSSALLRSAIPVSALKLIYLPAAFFRSGWRFGFGWQGGGGPTLGEVDAALRFALLKNSTELTDRGADGLRGSR